MHRSRYLIRHVLQTYAELEFASRLKKKYFTFLPLRDEGIDIVAVAKKKSGIMKCFQVKARNKGKQSYRFVINQKSFARTRNVPRLYYVFTLVDNERLVDHIVIPVDHLKKWMKIRNPEKRTILWIESKKQWRFDINYAHEEGSYYLKPRKGKLLLNDYVLRGKKTRLERII
jgi:hypothetical protein